MTSIKQRKLYKAKCTRQIVHSKFLNANFTKQSLTKQSAELHKINSTKRIAQRNNQND